jgi:hypothetical protein
MHTRRQAHRHTYLQEVRSRLYQAGMLPIKAQRLASVACILLLTCILFLTCMCNALFALLVHCFVIQ